MKVPRAASVIPTVLHRLLLLAPLALPIACAGGQAASALARPPDFAPPGQTKCSVARSQAKPLIIEWPSADRAAPWKRGSERATQSTPTPAKPAPSSPASTRTARAWPATPRGPRSSTTRHATRDTLAGAIRSATPTTPGTAWHATWQGAGVPAARLRRRMVALLQGRGRDVREGRWWRSRRRGGAAELREGVQPGPEGELRKREAASSPAGGSSLSDVGPAPASWRARSRASVRHDSSESTRPSPGRNLLQSPRTCPPSISLEATSTSSQMAIPPRRSRSSPRLARSASVTSGVNTRPR